MKRIYLALTALAGLAVGQAYADTVVGIQLSGGGISGTVVLSYGAATDSLYPQAFEITDVSGTFSDSNIGVDGATITGLEAINHATPQDPMNVGVAPNDFSQFAVGSGLPPVNGGVLTYDNLFWPNGAPPTAFDYPGDGSFLDIYGLMFKLNNGDVVDLFSNGVGFGPDPTSTAVFGVAVATSETSLDYVANGVTASTPEPSTWAMMILGFASLAFAAYRTSRKVTAAAA